MNTEPDENNPPHIAEDIAVKPFPPLPSAPKREGREPHESLLAGLLARSHEDVCKCYAISLEDSSHTDCEIEKMCAEVIGQEFVDGDTYFVPGPIACVEETIRQLKAKAEGATAGRVMTEAENLLIEATLNDWAENALDAHPSFLALCEAVAAERAVLPLEEGPQS